MTILAILARFVVLLWRLLPDGDDEVWDACLLKGENLATRSVWRDGLLELWRGLTHLVNCTNMTHNRAVLPAKQ